MQFSRSAQVILVYSQGSELQLFVREFCAALGTIKTAEKGCCWELLEGLTGPCGTGGHVVSSLNCCLL